MEKFFEAMLRENTKYVEMVGCETSTKEEQEKQLEVCESFRRVVQTMHLSNEWRKYFIKHYKDKTN